MTLVLRLVNESKESRIQNVDSKIFEYIIFDKPAIFFFQIYQHWIRVCMMTIYNILKVIKPSLLRFGVVQVGKRDRYV